MAVDMSKLNRPGVMSSYSSSGRKNTVHSSKSQVAGSTFNQAHITKASSFLQASKAGHVSANRISNDTPRYWNGQEMSIMSNRGSGQMSAFSSAGFMSGGFNPVGFGNMMPNMFGMGGASNTLALISGLTNLGLNVADKFGLFGSEKVQTQSASQQLDSILNTASSLSINTGNFEGVSQGISDAISAGNADDLAKAINSGHSKLASMDGMTSTYEAAVAKENSAVKTMQGQLENANKANEAADRTVNEKDGKVKTAEDNVSAKQKEASKFGEAYQKANDGYVNAHNNYVDAQNNTKQAQSALNDATKSYNDAYGEFTKAANAAVDAKNAYEAEPATDKNGNPNPKKDQLRAKMNLAIEQKNKAEEAKNAAEAKKNEAQTALNNAKQEEIAAKNNETTAKRELDKAKEQVTQNKQDLAQYEKALQSEMKSLDEAKADLNKAQITQQKAQEQVSKLEADIENANSAKTLLETHLANRDKLAQDIQNGEAKLNELKAKKPIDTPKKPTQETSTQISKEELAKLTPQATITAGDKTYTKYTDTNGQTVYACDGRKIDESAYNQVKSLLGETEA